MARCTLYDKVCQWLMVIRWFSLGTLISSNNKTDENIVKGSANTHHNHCPRYELIIITCVILINDAISKLVLWYWRSKFVIYCFEVYFVLHFKLNCCAIVEHFRSFKLYLCGIRYRFLNDPTYVRVGVYVCMFRLFNYLEF